MRPLLSLVGIFKDEARSIRAVLESAKPYVDRYTICDTGSTDDTPHIATDVMGSLPGAIHRVPFVDFSANRNGVLQIDNGNYVGIGVDGPSGEPAEFQLMLSGDEYLVGGAALRTHLEKHRDSDVDLHMVRVQVGPVSSYQPRVFRTGSGWRYEGVVHETPYNRVNGRLSIVFVDDVSIEHVVSDPDQRYQNIYEKHVPLLREAVYNNQKDARSWLFLSQSCECLLSTGALDVEEQVNFCNEAIYALSRYFTLDDRPDSELNEPELAERHYSQMKYYSLMYASGQPPEALYPLVSDLAERDSVRPETAFLRAEIAREMKSFPIAEVYKLYCKAIDSARMARSVFNTSPVDNSIEWKCHWRAVVLLKEFAKKHSGATTDVTTHIEAGRLAGGPPEIFDSFAQGADS